MGTSLQPGCACCGGSTAWLVPKPVNHRQLEKSLSSPHAAHSYPYEYRPSMAQEPCMTAGAIHRTYHPASPVHTSVLCYIRAVVICHPADKISTLLVAYVLAYLHLSAEMVCWPRDVGLDVVVCPGHREAGHSCTGISTYKNQFIRALTFCP